MDQQVAIQANGLQKFYPTGKVRALNDTDFVVRKGEIVAVTGPSGSGKSTLLYALAGLVDLDGGSVRILGDRPVSPSAWTKARRNAIGMVFQNDWLLPRLTAVENVELPMIGTGRSREVRRARALSLLASVNADQFGDRIPAELSGGERQRVAVARGLANQPKILLADEPTGQLDSANGRAVLELILQLQHAEALTVVLVTHDETIAAACRRRYVMQDGRGAFIPERVS